jgi:hypothetical protein
MIPVYVYTADPAGTFGPGGYIEFYGQALDTMYTSTNIYTVQVSTAPVNQLPMIDATPRTDLTPAAHYTEILTVNRELNYGYADSPSNDPWYDTYMEADGASKSYNFSFEVDGLASSLAPANLKLVVWGETSWPQNPDHHLVISLNGTMVEDTKFDGWVEKDLNLTIPSGVLQAGANTLTLTLPGDTGVSYDSIDLDKYTLTYERTFAAQNGQLRFTEAGNIFQVTNLPSANVEVFRSDAKGQAILSQVAIQPSGSTFTVTIAGTGEPATYLVTTIDALNSPTLVAARHLAVNLNTPAQYLIIAHPDFINNDLQRLVAARQAQGLTVNVVDVNDLYAKYTYGIFDPSAIKQYIAYAAKNLGTKYVLLVGGDTYDYRNYLGLNSISFIPSLYGSTGLINFVPADSLYVDLNNDNVPDLAIGRFPVRSSAELTMMVDKTLDYATKNYGNTAVFAADQTDGIISFKSFSDDLRSRLPSDWTTQNIYLDTTSVTTARTQLINAMNGGTSLVSFSGHSAPTQWSMYNLFNINNAKVLKNVEKPFVVVQWGCWNTYAINPTGNYLVQSFLFSGDQGAVAVVGSVTLANSNSEQRLGELLTPLLAEHGMSIGQALLNAKQQLNTIQYGLVDVQIGWALMGDPALVIVP